MSAPRSDRPQQLYGLKTTVQENNCFIAPLDSLDTPHYRSSAVVVLRGRIQRPIFGSLGARGGDGE
jgi:hypothetical protein